MNELARALARIIINRYHDDEEYRLRVNISPEFYRALVWESDLFENVIEFDGTDEYVELVDAIEDIL